MQVDHLSESASPLDLMKAKGKVSMLGSRIKQCSSGLILRREKCGEGCEGNLNMTHSLSDIARRLTGRKSSEYLLEVGLIKTAKTLAETCAE